MSLVRFVGRGLVLPLAALCAAAAAAALGGAFSGRLDILTHFAPFYLAGGLLILAISLFARQRRLLAGLGLVAALASLTLIVPEFTRPQSPLAGADARSQIKLIQFNAALDAAALEQRLNWLAMQDPDILVVEDSRAVFQTAVTQRLHRQMACGRTCEVAIFTRAPAARIESPRRGYYGQGPAMAVAFVNGPDGVFPVVGTHYDWPTRPTLHRRNAERLRQVLKDLPHERLILAGDFNSTPWSFARRADDAAFRMERRTRALPTWPANGPFGLPFLPIDHIYAGPGWATVSITRGPQLGSDHYPVVAILAPRQP